MLQPQPLMPQAQFRSRRNGSLAASRRPKSPPWPLQDGRHERKLAKWLVEAGGGNLRAFATFREANHVCCRHGQPNLRDTLRPRSCSMLNAVRQGNWRTRQSMR